MICFLCILEKFLQNQEGLRLLRFLEVTIIFFLLLKGMEHLKKDTTISMTNPPISTVFNATYYRIFSKFWEYFILFVVVQNLQTLKYFRIQKNNHNVKIPFNSPFERKKKALRSLGQCSRHLNNQLNPIFQKFYIVCTLE